ncbi:MAG TPA: hypothetical protein VMT38_10480 [Terracidiphilus sp.]|nr:hypothetical protein [Terracidiphilus sp.]
MLIVPETRAAIVRISVFAAVALIGVIGANRTHRGWARIVFLVVAIPATFETIFGICTILLAMHYGSH